MAAVSFCALSVALFPFALAGRSGHILTAQAQAQAQGPLGETGIRSGLKIRFLQGSAGSSPAGATIPCGRASKPDRCHHQQMSGNQPWPATA